MMTNRSLAGALAPGGRGAFGWFAGWGVDALGLALPWDFSLGVADAFVSAGLVFPGLPGFDRWEGGLDEAAEAALALPGFRVGLLMGVGVDPVRA